MSRQGAGVWRLVSPVLNRSSNAGEGQGVELDNDGDDDGDRDLDGDGDGALDGEPLYEQEARHELDS